jgi:hypothetical protein
LIVFSIARNGICPRNCSCAILYEELIEDACRDVRDHYAWHDEYPSYGEYMVAAQHAYWRACKERLCCQLDDNVRLPDCVMPIVHDYISVNGSDDEPIPAEYLGRAGHINEPIDLATPPPASQPTATQGSFETLSSGEDESKSASVLSAKDGDDGELDRLSKTMAVVTPGMKPTDKGYLKAVIRQFDKEEKEYADEFLPAYKAYRNSLYWSPGNSPAKLSALHYENPSEDSEEAEKKKTPLLFPVPNKEASSVDEDDNQKKPAASTTKKRLRLKDDIVDPDETDPKFYRIVKRSRKSTDQLTLTQYWPKGTHMDQNDSP